MRQIARHVASSHTKWSGTRAPMPLHNRPFQSGSVGEIQLCVGDGTAGRTCKKQDCVGRAPARSFLLCKYAETLHAQEHLFHEAGPRTAPPCSSSSSSPSHTHHQRHLNAVYFGLISSLIANSKVHAWNKPDLDIMTAARSAQKAVFQTCYLEGINQWRTKMSRRLSVAHVEE